MDRDLGQILTQDYEDKVSRVGVAFVQQQDKSDKRFKNIEAEVMLMKAAVGSGGTVPSHILLRDPPGYPHAHGLNMRESYAAGGACGAACGPGCGGAAGAG